MGTCESINMVYQFIVGVVTFQCCNRASFQAHFLFDCIFWSCRLRVIVYSSLEWFLYSALPSPSRKVRCRNITAALKEAVQVQVKWFWRGLGGWRFDKCCFRQKMSLKLADVSCVHMHCFLRFLGHAWCQRLCLCYWTQAICGQWQVRNCTVTAADQRSSSVVILCTLQDVVSYRFISGVFHPLTHWNWKA